MNPDVIKNVIATSSAAAGKRKTPLPVLSSVTRKNSKLQTLSCFVLLILFVFLFPPEDHENPPIRDSEHVCPLGMIKHPTRQRGSYSDNLTLLCARACISGCPFMIHMLKFTEQKEEEEEEESERGKYPEMKPDHETSDDGVLVLIQSELGIMACAPAASPQGAARDAPTRGVAASDQPARGYRLRPALPPATSPQGATAHGQPCRLRKGSGDSAEGGKERARASF
ncbi:hypothetical protein GW17_00062220 [Ensete ventricosum]|nr:hypothetical protein GW17_00062220 [Ensete ventricosum]RZS10242.1 hypothetical protein BHM03_00041431 [Ensete ventricosum]